jgi:cation diffusion facilitator CzcD-associated flavoprotein CzcO
MTDVAVIGAGPYGLSVAAHLAALGISTRAFGSPMSTWRTSMPEGMVLKSEGFASSLYDPNGALTLGTYCAQHGLPYADFGLPVPLETFCEYGLAFQKRFVPMLDERMVSALEPSSDGFVITLDDGETVTARRVVVAAGIRHFAATPPEFDPLRGPLLSHSAEHHFLGGFAGKDVLVVGGGASGVELAALMQQKGASVTLAARRERIAFCEAPRPRSVVDKLKAPMSGLGTGWRSLACVVAPMVFYRMPQDFRMLVVRKHLGPAPGWALRDHFEQHVPAVLGATVAAARERSGRAEVTLRLKDGSSRSVTADHVVAATGYKVDLRRLTFLSDATRSRIRSADHTPVLSRYFESSIPDLYFVGSTAANSFGPLLRFAFGAGFAARRLSQHLVRSASRRRVPTGVTLAPAGT